MDSQWIAPAAIGPLGRVHARRLREIYRSAGWPCQDGIEIELLAAGLLQRVGEPCGGERVRVTEAGLQHLAQVLQRNRRALSAHEALVARVAQSLRDAGRIVWTGLAVRARLPAQAALAAPAGAPPGHGPMPGRPDGVGPDADPVQFALSPDGPAAAAARWKVCKPDVFSIRNTTVEAYLQPVVHEIKVSRADLLGDLRHSDKRDSYLDIAGQCWYVLGQDARGHPIAQADEVPTCCGVMQALADGRLDIVRPAPQRAMSGLPFSVWMALAKATALDTFGADGTDGALPQAPLQELAPDGK